MRPGNLLTIPPGAGKGARSASAAGPAFASAIGRIALLAGAVIRLERVVGSAIRTITVVTPLDVLVVYINPTHRLPINRGWRSRERTAEQSAGYKGTGREPEIIVAAIARTIIAVAAMTVVVRTAAMLMKSRRRTPSPSCPSASIPCTSVAMRRHCLPLPGSAPRRPHRAKTQDRHVALSFPASFRLPFRGEVRFRRMMRHAARPVARARSGA